MEIKRNKEFEEHILETVRTNWINKVRTDIALTDLIYPREAYLKRINIVEPSQTQVLDFLRGKSIEEGLGKLLKLKHPEAKCVEGIWYNPDFRFEFKKEDHIMELKSRRSYLAKEGEEVERYKYYLTQVKGYCALDNRLSAYLTVFSIAEKADDGWRTEPKIVCYLVEFTQEELDEELQRLIGIKDLFNLTIADGDFTRLPECDSSRCGITHKNMIKNPFCTTCNRTFSSDYFLNRHFKGLAGKDHTGIYGTYEYRFEARCPHIAICKPKVYGELSG